jgi:predicted secreted Zn-dependent protease
VNESEYPVTGDTRDEIAASINSYWQGRSRDKPWDGYIAYATWNVQWRYRFVEKAGRCRVTRVRVAVDVDVVYPRWDPPLTASPILVSRWQYNIAALRLHERGHAQNGLDTAAEVVRALTAIKSKGTCKQLERALDAAGEAIVERGAERDKVYDLETGHGRTQGVGF